MTWFRSIWSRIDRFLAAILLTVAFASLMPARGEAAVAVGWLTDAAIAAVVFHARRAAFARSRASWGAAVATAHDGVPEHVRAVSAARNYPRSFLAPNLLPAPLWAGLILLTALPSTVQASIAFTSVAGGNVPAALCSASASNVLGVFLTPLIAGFLLSRHGVDLSARSVFAIVVQLLLPFVAGQLLRPWIGELMSCAMRAC